MLTCLTINAKNLRKIYIDGPSLAVLMREAALVRIPLRRLGKIIIHGDIRHILDAEYHLYCCRTDRDIPVLLCDEFGQLKSEILPCRRDFLTREIFLDPLKYNPSFLVHYQKWLQKTISPIHLQIQHLFNTKHHSSLARVTVRTEKKFISELFKHLGLDKNEISSPENDAFQQKQVLEKKADTLCQRWTLQDFDQMLCLYNKKVFRTQEITELCQDILNELLTNNLKSKLQEMGSGATGRGSRAQLFNDFFPELQRLAFYLIALWFDDHTKIASRESIENCYYLNVFKEVNQHVFNFTHDFEMMMREFYFIEDKYEVINL